MPRLLDKPLRCIKLHSRRPFFVNRSTPWRASILEGHSHGTTRNPRSEYVWRPREHRDRCAGSTRRFHSTVRGTRVYRLGPERTQRAQPRQAPARRVHIEMWQRRWTHGHSVLAFPLPIASPGTSRLCPRCRLRRHLVLCPGVSASPRSAQELTAAWPIAVRSACPGPRYVPPTRHNETCTQKAETKTHRSRCGSLGHLKVARIHFLSCPASSKKALLP